MLKLKIFKREGRIASSHLGQKWKFMIVNKRKKDKITAGIKITCLQNKGREMDFRFLRKSVFPRSRLISFIVNTAIIKQNQFHTKNINNDPADWRMSLWDKYDYLICFQKLKKLDSVLKIPSLCYSATSIRKQNVELRIPSMIRVTRSGDR